MVVFRQSGCNREKLLFSDKVVVFVARVVGFGQSGCIWQKWLYSGKVVVLGKSGGIRQRCCIWAKWFLSSKSSCVRANLVVFRTK